MISNLGAESGPRDTKYTRLGESWSRSWSLNPRSRPTSQITALSADSLERESSSERPKTSSPASPSTPRSNTTAKDCKFAPRVKCVAQASSTCHGLSLSPDLAVVIDIVHPVAGPRQTREFCVRVFGAVLTTQIVYPRWTLSGSDPSNTSLTAKNSPNSPKFT